MAWGSVGSCLDQTHVAGLRVSDLDLRVRPAQGQLGPVGAERQAPDHVLGAVKGRKSLAGLPVPKLDCGAALASRELPARAGGDQSPVGAEGDRAEATGGHLQREPFGVAEPLDVVPFPAAALDRAAVEQVLGQGDVVVLHLAIGPVDPVDVILPGQVLGTLVGDLGLFLGESLGLRLGLRQGLGLRERPIDLGVGPDPPTQQRRQEQEDRRRSAPRSPAGAAPT